MSEFYFTQPVRRWDKTEIANSKKMNSFPFYSKTWFLLLFTIWAASAAPTVCAQSDSGDLNQSGAPSSQFDLLTDPITASVYVGVDPERPYRRSESWIPMTVELENRQEAFKGSLVVRMKGGSVEYSVPVNLPPKAKKSYDLAVFFPPMLDELEFYIKERSKETQIELVAVPSSYAETDRFIAVISAERGSHDHYAHRPEDEEIDLYRRVLYTAPAFLPRYSIAYQSLDVLMWDGGPNSALSPEQDAALESWIQMGGTLILAAGDYWQELNNSPFRLYTPMTLNGSRVLNAGTALDNPSEVVRPVLNSSVVIAAGELLDDPNIHVWLKAGDDPFLIERKWGAGRIVFVASSLNKPLFSDPIQQIIFKDFLTKSYLPFNAKVVSYIDDVIARFLRVIIQAELPGTWFIALYLGCYILLVVPINYIVFRMLGRLEWAWFTVPIWAVIFAYGAYYIGALRQQGQVAVNQISIVEARPSASAAQATTYNSIYSPVRNWYSISFQNPVAFPQLLQTSTPRRTESLSEESLNIQFTNQGAQVDDFIIYHWSQRSLKTQHEVKIGGGVDIDLQWKSSRITGSIANHTGAALHAPTIYLKKYQFNIPDLQDGESCKIDQDLNTTPAFHPQSAMNNYRRIDEKEEMPDFIRNELKEAYSSQFFSEYPAMGMAVLAAQVDRSQLTFAMNDQPIIPKEGQTLLCQIFPLKEKLQGRLLLQNNAWNYANISTRPGAQSQPMIVSIPPNRGFGGYGMAGMRIQDDANRITNFQVPPDAANYWDIVSDVSLVGSKIDSFRLEVNYQKLGFFPSTQPNAPAAAYNPDTGRPAKPEFELSLEDLYERTYHPLSKIQNEDGEILNPGRYVDKVTGIISARIQSPPGRNLRISMEAIQIHLLVNFGTEAGGKFLGYFVDAVAEDASVTN
ncbi:MAG: hypothetical protein JXR73_13180 [Candidatus Omnitrophica bacterium]|nr:hypothetical protein [Candidatus Omnitrophota bacterium]